MIVQFVVAIILWAWVFTVIANELEEISQRIVSARTVLGEEVVPDRACEFLGIPHGTTFDRLGRALDECSSDALRDLPWKQSNGPYTHRHQS